MKQSDFIIRTDMEQEDYKKFLFIDNFQTGKLILILVISVFVSGVVNYINKTMNIASFIKYFAMFIGIFLAVRALKTFSTYQGIKKMYKTGQLGYTNIFSFKEDEFIIQNSKISGSTAIGYKNISYVRETNDFILLYVTPKQCSAIRKKDIENMDAFREFLIEKFDKNFKS